MLMWVCILACLVKSLIFDIICIILSDTFIYGLSCNIMVLLISSDLDMFVTLY